MGGTGIFNQLSIAYAFPPRLRSRLTLRRTSLPQETLGFRWTRFSLVFSLLIPAFSLLYTPPAPYGTASIRMERSPTTCTLSVQVHSFGSVLEPRDIFGAEPLDQ